LIVIATDNPSIKIQTASFLLSLV